MRFFSLVLFFALCQIVGTMCTVPDLSLADDASVDAVLEPLAPLIPKTTWIVDHTTTAVTPTAERAARWNACGSGR